MTSFQYIQIVKMFRKTQHKFGARGHRSECGQHGQIEDTQFKYYINYPFPQNSDVDSKIVTGHIKK